MKHILILGAGSTSQQIAEILVEQRDKARRSKSWVSWMTTPRLKVFQN